MSAGTKVTLLTQTPSYFGFWTRELEKFGVVRLARAFLRKGHDLMRLLNLLQIVFICATGPEVVGPFADGEGLQVAGRCWWP